MSLPGNRFEVLRLLEEQQRAFIAKQEQEKEERRRQIASAMPNSGYRFEQLNPLERQQGVEAPKQDEANRHAKVATDVKPSAERQVPEIKATADAAAALAAKEEQDRKDRAVENAARAWKIMHESGANSATADIKQLIIREERHSAEQRRQIEQQYPGDLKKLEQHDQITDRNLDAFISPDKYLQNKSSDEIRKIAREGYLAEQDRLAGTVKHENSQTPAQIATKDRLGNRPEHDALAAYQARVLDHNRLEAAAHKAKQDDGAQRQPEATPPGMDGPGRSDERGPVETWGPTAIEVTQRKKPYERPRISPPISPPVNNASQNNTGKPPPNNSGGPQVRPDQGNPPPNNPDGSQLRPEQAATDTRGFDRGYARSPARAAPKGEMTEAKVERSERQHRIPRSDAQAFIEASNARSAERANERDHTPSGGRGL